MPAVVRGPQSVDKVPAFVHTQAEAATVWTIGHGLGFYPNVTVVDTAGTMVEGDVHYDSKTQLTITFSAAFAGQAYLS